MDLKRREDHDREEKDGKIRNGVEHTRRDLRGVRVDGTFALCWWVGCDVVALPEIVEGLTMRCQSLLSIHMR